MHGGRMKPSPARASIRAGALRRPQSSQVVGCNVARPRRAEAVRNGRAASARTADRRFPNAHGRDHSTSFETKLLDPVRCSALGFFFNRLESDGSGVLVPVRGALRKSRVGGRMRTPFNCCSSSAQLSRLSGRRSDSDATWGKHVSERYPGRLGPSLRGVVRHRTWRAAVADMPRLNRQRTGCTRVLVRYVRNVRYVLRTRRPDDEILTRLTPGCDHGGSPQTAERGR